MAFNDISPAFTYDQQPHYDYTPLASPSKSFRLFHLQPLQVDGVIRGTIRQHAIEKGPQYVALSYEWGPAQVFHWIEVDGRHFRVRSNLFDILTECVRRENVDQPFFIDATCIDQSNGPERNSQVGLMSTIYRQSFEVSVWLTAATPYIQGLFNFLAYHHNNPDLADWKYTNRQSATGRCALLHASADNGFSARELHPTYTRTQVLATGEEICFGRTNRYGIRTEPGADFRCLSCELATLMKATCWSRAWITPEFFLGQATSINCMRSTISSRMLEYGFNVLISDNSGPDSPEKLCPEREYSITEVPSFSPAQGFKVLGMRRQWRENVGTNKAIDILELTDGLGEQYCADDRDRIYSLLCLDPYCVDFPIDYTHSRLRLFLEVARFLDKRHRTTTFPKQDPDWLRMGWRTLSNCYSVTEALKLHSNAHTADIKREVKQFEVDHQCRAFCSVGELCGIQSISRWYHYSGAGLFSEFIVSNLDWSTNVEIRADDRFVDLSAKTAFHLGVVFRFNGVAWQVLGIAAPPRDPDHVFLFAKDHWLPASLEAQRVLASGEVRHVKDVFVFELGLSHAVELHLLLCFSWLQYRKDALHNDKFIDGIADEYHSWYHSEYDPLNE